VHAVILAYHSHHMAGSEYASNDHVALRVDSRAARRSRHPDRLAGRTGRSIRRRKTPAIAPSVERIEEPWPFLAERFRGHAATSASQRAPGCLPILGRRSPSIRANGYLR
jgi:hypothetical protein